MQKKYEDGGWLPASIMYKPTKQLLDRVELKLDQDREISKDKKETYVRIIKEINYTMGKVDPFWPQEVEKIVDNLKSIVMELEGQLIAIGKGSSLFCGTSANPKQLENIFRRLAGYQHVFSVIRPFQDRRIRDDIVARYEQERGKIDNSRKTASRKEDIPEKVAELEVKAKANLTKQSGPCEYCQLMQAVSVCPNGFIAKKLIKKLPDTQWIAGILHEEGTIVDKDLDKAIEFYKMAYSKKNYEALYRLGSLNERGLYGKPLQYLKMWEEASAGGHMEALTDMGYLYENGLQDEDTGRTILQPNFQKALAYYKRAAQKNFPRALNNLATFYFSNEKYRDQKKCLQYLELASEAQYVKSLHNLGLIYYQGKLVPFDAVKSRTLIRRAAEKGDIEGRIMYIQIMLNDVQHCTADQLVELNRYCRDIIAKDEQNHEAYYFLGIIYEEGYGVKKQPKTAFLYYTLAADLQNEGALLKLGECFKNGFGVEQDMREAIRCYEQASKANKQALISLGEIYEKGGQQLNPNYQRAFECYYEACNCGLPQAYVHLGNMYKNGRHVKKSDVKAEQYFEKARNIERNSNTKKLNASSSDLIQSSYYRRR